MLWFIVAVIFVSSRTLVDSIPIPNGIIGLPEVECGQDTIDVVFNLNDTFNGKVYVNGFANDTNCVGTEKGRRTTSLTIPKNGCGVTTLRSVIRNKEADPPGLLVTVKVSISFHPLFVTKVDRGFDLTCFYMEADKTATYPLTVNPASLAAITELGEMPRCTYQVLTGGPTGQPATVVAVGDALYHKWNCVSSAANLWCMTVHSCYVEDGAGTRVEVLNDNGCAVDKFILNNLDYQSALMAGKEAHAFKFADKLIVNFQCSIRLDIKDGECKRPVCPALRKRRNGESEKSNEVPPVENLFDTTPVAEVDVRSRPIDVIDPLIDFDSEDGRNVKDAIKRVKSTFSQERCLSMEILAIPVACCSFIVLICISVCLILSFKANRQKDISS